MTEQELNINEIRIPGYYELDCMEIIKDIPDKFFDVAIVDPPYGHLDIGTDRTGIVIEGNKRTVVPGGEYEKINWNVAPSAEYFKELKRISTNQIIWGFNFLREAISEEYDSKGIIVWDKVNEGTDQYPIEVAYQSFDDRPHLFRYMWRGMLQGKSITEGHLQQGNKNLNEKRIHPCQKPVNLYKWLIKEFDISADKIIIDTHVGSGSSLIAFYDNSNKYLGFENDKEMFKKSNNRLQNYQSQMSMFSGINNQ